MQRIFILLLFMGLSNGVSELSECISQGRYPNDDVENCKGYTVCITGGASNYAQYKLTCPVGFVYSHLEQKCTNATAYRCLESYNCTKMGNFVNTDSKSCTSYVACVEGINNLVSARLIDCPENTIFNPNVQLCVNETEYTCRAKPIDVFELPGSISFYEFTANVTVSSAVSFCSKHVTMFSLLIFLIIIHFS